MASATQPITAVSPLDARTQLDQLERLRLEKEQAAQALVDTQTARAKSERVLADKHAAQLQNDAASAERARLASDEADRVLAERAHADVLAERARVAGDEANRIAAQRDQAKRTQTVDEAAQRERLTTEARDERTRLDGVHAYQAETERVQADAVTEQAHTEQLQTQRVQAELDQIAEFDATHIDRVAISDPARVQSADPNNLVQPQ